MKINKKIVFISLGIIAAVVAVGCVVAGIIINEQSDFEQPAPVRNYRDKGYTPDEKPLIYLYPQEKTSVVVQLGHPERITVTYPEYDNNTGWNVIAQPSGELTDTTGRSFYGLYWEGMNYHSGDFNDGFVVSREETTTFLEEKLAVLGLTEREANEFIIYWLPKLQKSEYNLIRFESLEDINNEMPLDITPTPDTLIRVMMEYQPLTQKIEITEQRLVPAPSRTGFTVVEWGGSLVENVDTSR